MTTKTSSHAVLFTKDKCAPCVGAKSKLKEVLDENPNFANAISVMQKENHPALVSAYDLQLFPTLLIVDSLGEERDRIVGGSKIIDQLKGVLFTLTTITK